MKLSRFLFRRRACSGDRSTFWSIVSISPLIVYIQGSIKFMVYAHAALGGRRAFMLRGPIGCEEHPRYSRKWGKYYKRAREFYPQHRVTFLCNTRSQSDRFREKGIPAVFFSQNALLDENVYKIVRNAPKEFDAVYNAQMEPVKRHELASEESVGLSEISVDMLLYISYNCSTFQGTSRS